MICFVPFTSTLSAEPRRRWARVIVKGRARGLFYFLFFLNTRKRRQDEVH